MKRVKITIPEGGERHCKNGVIIHLAKGTVFEINAPEMLIEGDVSLNQDPAQRIPFDLEAAKAGAAIVTRDGRNVRFLAYVPEAFSGAQVLAYIKGDDGAREFSASGKARPHSGEAFDLFMAPKPRRTVWVNLYRQHSSAYYESAEEARNAALPGAIARAVPIEV